MVSALKKILESYRDKALSERDKGSAFERLIQFYLINDPKYDFSEVYLWREWAELQGADQRDTGIDLVAVDRETETVWAVQCKFYAEDAKIYKKHVDSFFTESGKKPYGQRLIVLTTPETSEHVKKAMVGQQVPCATLNLLDLEESPIDWAEYRPGKQAAFREKKTLRPHQKKALEKVREGFKEKDRGKLIMACGTGKTFTALRIAEDRVGIGGKVLFLVPSLSLLSQTLTEWTADSEVPLHAFAVCSDSSTGKRKSDDLADIEISDLAYPATTDAKSLAVKMEREHPDKMTVVFSTYHSIAVISEAQKKHGLEEFDLIVCDEAHRTTGATAFGAKESHFVKVHSQDFIKSLKRLYMTATPKVFGEPLKEKAKEVDATICSMDDEALYGPVLHTVTFSEAVRLGLLSDYKVLVLAIDEGYASSKLQDVLAGQGSELPLDDASKILGCWKALSKRRVKEDLADDENPMKRAVAFCRDIKTSKRITEYFPQVVEKFIEEENLGEDALECELNHVDGSYSDYRRRDLLAWLKEDSESCRILTNARCLSEGIDVPSLDAILFMNPRKSQIDIVQSVGRVMRKAPGKTRGYVVLPIAVPAGLTPEVALDDNEKYRVVWQILQALRSHDDRFEALINKIDLGGDPTDKIEVIDIGGEEKEEKVIDGTQEQLPFSGFEKAIYAKLVKKCGNRRHWEDWAGDIAKIANAHITRITTLLEKDGTKERKAFDDFLAEIRDDLNESITEAEAIEMLAQHIITKPVFDALFKGHKFAASNPVSQAMEGILGILNEQNLESESETLKGFYESIRFRAEGIENAEGRQRIILELYDKFFRNAFPRLTEKLGIVYTPVEVVDFIIHSVNDVLKNEFGESLGSKGVHILDPFVGTGTFITRLLQSGLIKREELPFKYKEEIHCNEIVLLAYYIAAINIESVYHDMVDDEYHPFGGICLTDTFQLYEKDDMISSLLVDNSSRRARQKKLDIKVILGNPPYSIGQSSANDKNQNVEYPTLDESIQETYARNSKMTSVKSLYDSYIRAIRWASDRIGDSGVMAYVTNAGWIESNTCDGMRKCLAEEFSSIYIFHLRGNQRTQGEQSRKEGGKIFGSGSRAPISISLLVKNPEAKESGKIYFYDIGDYLTQEEKLTKIRNFKSVEGISEAASWEEIKPDKHNDWVNQRDDSFYDFIKIGDRKAPVHEILFDTYSLAVATGRDVWCYNFSEALLGNNIESMIDFYNSEVESFELAKLEKQEVRADDHIRVDLAKISWNATLKKQLERGKKLSFDQTSLRASVYRPFSKQWVYFSSELNERCYQMYKLFPNSRAENLVIAVNGKGAKSGSSVFMVNVLLDLNMLEAGAQCFPLWVYEKQEKSEQTSLLDGEQQGEYRVRDGITDEGLKHFTSFYKDDSITKEDIFYYIYGLLHHERYREKYADNLSKELPRIPRVKTSDAFSRFVEAGRKLGDLHVNYEKVKPHPVNYKRGEIDLKSLSAEDLYVTKMKFGKGKDKSTVIYNHKITMTGIPLEAYEYVVNGKPAVEWVMDRQVVKTDKKSQIVNDCNRYAVETVKDPAYPLKLFQRVITVSLETMKIVRALPKLDI